MSLALGLAGCARAYIADEHVNVVMKKYSISPEVIRVKQGKVVEFELKTADVQHGFDVPELGIKESVQPGRATVFSIRADRKGEFKIECGVLCGPHHDDMRGKLIVE
ncbi:MAG: cytochrome-c oxidase [Candidatus Angelobacter sp.]|nr:cytochrome-c oxidase [Candidatus Angelobacter sp.]